MEEEADERKSQRGLEDMKKTRPISEQECHTHELLEIEVACPGLYSSMSVPGDRIPELKEVDTCPLVLTQNQSPIENENLVSFKGVSLGKQMSLKYRLHAQQSMASRKPT